jgi:phosphoribosylglycinamide formyltransferase
LLAPLRIVVLISGSGEHKPIITPLHRRINSKFDSDFDTLFDPDISSLGTNLQALIDAQPFSPTPASIVLVLSNRKAAYGLTRASTAQPPISTAYLALQPYLKAHPGHTRDDYDHEVGQMVLSAKPDIVVLAGWMHVFGDRFLNLMAGPFASAPVTAELEDPTTLIFPIPVINLHPALPGQFDGAHAIDRAWDAFHAPNSPQITKTGVMVHRVVRQVDAGEPIIVEEVPFVKEETKEQFEERLHRVEWKIIVQATGRILEERMQQRSTGAAQG